MKDEEVYLSAYASVSEARASIGRYLNWIATMSSTNRLCLCAD
ncbi:hypothetical protein BIWAKO_04149 [Bosea sp. BIWAKO-01]|nr:hypothetical protein BIWAKO_04149 [Bosea sp. BIWAKO-01]